MKFNCKGFYADSVLFLNLLGVDVDALSDEILSVLGGPSATLPPSQGHTCLPSRSLLPQPFLASPSTLSQELIMRSKGGESLISSEPYLWCRQSDGVTVGGPLSHFSFAEQAPSLSPLKEYGKLSHN